MLATSREALHRITTLALAYRVTGDHWLAERAEAELRNVCEFSDWNVDHFLDTAEMAAAVALGYDWLHDELHESTRLRIREALVKRALVHCRSGAGWRTSDHNWNSVCYAGLALGALAIAEHEPELAAEVLREMRRNNPRVLATYAPDGVYPEGPAYWQYGTLFQAMLVEALRSGLGDDFGLASPPGMATTGDFLIHTIGPSGDCFNFADSRPGRHDSPAVFWAAREFDRPEWLRQGINTKELARSHASMRLRTLAALWWPRGGMDTLHPEEPPLCWLGRGKQSIATFRSAWDDPDAMYLAVKAGRAAQSHGHMDAGSFVFELDGVRWAIDLGRVNYHAYETREIKIWDRSQDGDRWRVPSYRNDFHNTVTVGRRLHVADAAASLGGFRDLKSRGSIGGVTVSLASTLGDSVADATRRYQFDPTHGTVIIEDQLTGIAPGTPVDWTLLTRARAAISESGDAVTLRQAGRALRLVSQGQTPGRWSVESLVQAARSTPGAVDAALPGDVTRLRWTASTPTDGEVNVRVTLAAAEPTAGVSANVRPHGATPSSRQLAWHDREFYAFVHFNMNTFTGVEWGQGDESPDRFAPTGLDCRQWCALFKECGLSGVILTVKHHDGFCLWDSAYTEHDVANSPWRDGQGDVLRELAKACEEYGLWVGVYISPWDRNNPIYGRDDAEYNDYFVGQLEELLSGYGPIAEVWWDGANGDRNNPEKHQEYDWKRYIEVVRRLQPGAVIFAPPETSGDIRWVGNEIGVAGETQWATYPQGGPEDHALLKTGVEGAPDWMPAETDVSIRPGWYWTEESNEQVKSLEHLLDIYHKSVGRNTNLLLNFPVDSRGLVHEADAAALRQLSNVLKATYGSDLAAGATATSKSAGEHSPPGAVVDTDPDNFWTATERTTAGGIEITLTGVKRFDRVVLQEPIRFGQRVRGWSLDARVAGGWREVARGTTIGHKRIAVFDPIEGDAVRLRITDSLARPLIRRIGVYKAPSGVAVEPAANTFVDRQTIHLTPTDPGLAVHYTLDGSRPTRNSLRYTGPFEVTDDAAVRAVAVTDGGVSPLVVAKDYRAFASAEFRDATDPGGLQPGLRVERFEGGWQTLDQMPTRTPVSEGVSATFNAGERTRDDNAALRFTGYVDVPADGVYEFRLTSDDGSRLWIGEERLVDHDGLHGMNSKSASIGLRAGKHPIRVEWFNVGAGLGLRVEWSGPRFGREPIPADRLRHTPGGRVSVKALNYRGWEDAVELSNDHVRVVVVPSIGRVIHYSLLGEPNLLHVEDSFAGVVLDGDGPLVVDGEPVWAAFGGDRVWPTEEKLFATVNGAKRPPDVDVDGLAWKSEPIPNGVAIESRVSRYAGVAVRREVTLAPDSVAVTIRQTMTKHADPEPARLRPMPVTIWSISKVAAPEALLFPIGSGDRFAGGVFVPKWDDARNHAANNLTFRDRVAVLAAPNSGEHQKAGANAPGWVAAIVGDRVLTHFFDHDPVANYPDGGTSATVYQNATLGELEVLSPLAPLRPGESTEHTVRWEIGTLPSGPLSDRVEAAVAWARATQEGTQ